MLYENILWTNIDNKIIEEICLKYNIIANEHLVHVIIKNLLIMLISEI